MLSCSELNVKVAQWELKAVNLWTADFSHSASYAVKLLGNSLQPLTKLLMWTLQSQSEVIFLHFRPTVMLLLSQSSGWGWGGTTGTLLKMEAGWKDGKRGRILYSHEENIICEMIPIKLYMLIKHWCWLLKMGWKDIQCVYIRRGVLVLWNEANQK